MNRFHRVAAVPFAATVAALLAVGPAAQGSPPRLEEIGQAYARQYASLQSLRLDYQEKLVAAAPLPVLFECTQMYELPSSRGTVIVDSQGRTYLEWSSARRPLDALHKWLQKNSGRAHSGLPTDWSLADLQRALPRVDPAPEDFQAFFDGSRLVKRSPYKLVQRGVARASYNVDDISRLSSPYFASLPLLYSLVAFPCPGLPQDDEFRRRHRVPELFAAAAFTVLPTTEAVGGTPCVVVEAPEFDRLWLAPSLNYAVVKRQLYLERQLRVEVRCEGFRQVTPEMWLPRKMKVTEYALRGFMPEQYAGQPLLRREYTYTKLEANQPAQAAVFRFEPGAGELVIDANLVPADQRAPKNSVDGTRIIPTVSYIVPADQSDLDAVISEAVRDQTGRNWRQISLWGVVLAVNVGLLLYGVGRYVRRERNG